MDCLHIPVCNVTHNQGAEEEAQVHTGLKKVYLPGISTYQVKLQQWKEKETETPGKARAPLPSSTRGSKLADPQKLIPSGWISCA